MNNKRQRNKLFTMLLLVIALLIPQWGWAQTPSKPALGDGSEENPFQLSSADELVWYANWVNGGTDKSPAHGSACAKLINDIDMNNRNMDPIGNVNDNTKTYYSGVFNGNGKSISNLKIIEQDNLFVGLFGYSNGATIKNITFINATVEGKKSYSTSGILAGQADNSTISGIKIINSNLKGHFYVGGIIGVTISSTVLNCESNATVSGEKYVGGIIGMINSSNSFKNILSLGNVSYTGDGGLLFGYINTDAKVHCIGAVVYDKDASLTSSTGDRTDSSNAAIGIGSLSSGTILSCSKDMLKSGFVTFILQQNSKADDVSWGQNLSEENGDEYPILGSTRKVYAKANIKLNCNGTYDETGSYTNSGQEEEYELQMTHGSSTYKEGTPATCTQNGILNHYECDICHNVFEDQELGVYLVDVTDYAKNHDYGTNDICTRCNASIPEVEVGQNTIKIAMVSPVLDKIAGYNLFKFISTEGPSMLSFTCNSSRTCFSLWDSNKKLLENVFLTDSKLAYSIEANTIYYIGVKDTESKAIDKDITLTLEHIVKPEGLVGSGMKNNPFILKTEKHLKFFADYVNGTNSGAYIYHSEACAKIADDVEEINMSSICHPVGGDYDSEVSWNPITASNYWCGFFDGNGKTISNLYINANKDNVGMFGYAYEGSVIKNLTLKKAIVKNAESQSKSGILVGNTYHATIQNIVIDSESSISAGSNTGGIVGYTGHFSEISNCINCAEVKGSSNVGGIVGSFQTSYLKNVFSNSNVTATECGGLIAGDSNPYMPSGLFAYNKDAVLTINGTQVDAKATGSGSLSSTAYTKDEVKSGKLAYALNDGVTDGSQIWYQKLGEDGDAYPMMKSTGENTVYGAYHHGDKDRFFSNTVIANQHSVAYNAEAEDEANGNHDVSYEAGEYAWTDEDKTQAPTVAVTYTCKVCRKTVTPENMTVEHDAEHDNVAATCTEEGHNYFKTSYTFNDKAVFSDAYTQTLPALGHKMSEDVTFNNSKSIYQKGCTRENCDYHDYYATSDASVAAKANDDETTFVVDKFTVDDATVYDSKARFKVNELTYKRTFNHTGWQAVYVPFDIECGQISDDYELAYINNFHEYEMLDDANIELEVMRITNNAVMPALTPCLIRKKQLSATESAKSETFHFADVWCKPAADRAIDCASVTRYYEFFGTLKGKDSFDPYNDFYMTSEGLVKANDGKPLDPQRWYLRATDRIGGLLYPTAQLSRIAIRVIGDDEPTGMENIYVKTDTGVANGSKQGIYDLQGRKLSQEPENGIYIKDGKKYVK